MAMALEVKVRQDMDKLMKCYKLRDEDCQNSKSLWSYWRSFVAPQPTRRIIEDIQDALQNYSKEDPFPSRDTVFSHLVDICKESQEFERPELLVHCRRWFEREDFEDQGKDWVMINPITSDGLQARDWIPNVSALRILRLLTIAIVKVDIMAIFRPPRPEESSKSKTPQQKLSFFEFAASQNESKFISAMLEIVGGATNIDSDRANEARQSDGILKPCESVTDGLHSALRSAIENSAGETVEIILDYCSKYNVKHSLGHDNSAHTAFQSCNEFQEPSQALLLRTLIKHGIHKSWDLEVLVTNFIQNGRILLFGELISCAGIDNKLAFSDNNCRDIIMALKHKQLWRMFWDFCKHHNFAHCSGYLTVIEGESNDLLHTAVNNQRHDVVSDLLHKFPGLAKARDEEGKYALQYLRMHSSDGEVGNEIACQRTMRDIIVSALILNETPRAVHDIMLTCKLEIHESNLDLSNFDFRAAEFPDFITSLSNEGGGLKPNAKGRAIQFEKVLGIVKFPALERPDHNLLASKGSDHDEIKEVLLWLRLEMKVTRIKRLVVPDRLYAPHDWILIHWCVRTFGVRELDWRRSDLYLRDPDGECCEHRTAEINEFGCCCLQTLQDIVLYTSGNQNVITQWLGNDGLKALGQLEFVKIHIIEDFVSPARSERLEKVLMRRLAAFPDHPTGRKVQRFEWTSMSAADEITTATTPISPVPELSRFLEKYGQLCLSAGVGASRTKVAIIDEGMMYFTKDHRLQTQARRQIVGGKNFAFREDDVHQWFSPGSDPHGTQMACLISNLDPNCELYIARVCAPRIPVSIRALSQAIFYAVDVWKVDIISMSLALNRNEQDNIPWEDQLERAIKHADSNNVVMMCSTMDEGRNVDAADALPARYSQTCAIAATDGYGNLKPWSEPKDYEYSFRGDSNALRSLDFLKTETKISGSSIATATASGLASLIVSCSCIAFYIKHEFSPRDSKKVRGSWKKDAVMKKMSEMCSGNGTKYVLPRRIHDKVQIEETDGDDELVKVILDQFGKCIEFK